MIPPAIAPKNNTVNKIFTMSCTENSEFDADEVKQQHKESCIEV